MKMVVVWAVAACTVLADGQAGRGVAAPNLVIAANLVYSPADRKVLMVSGAANLNTNALARVWSWDGRAWSAQGAEGPLCAWSVALPTTFDANSSYCSAARGRAVASTICGRGTVQRGAACRMRASARAITT